MKNLYTATDAEIAAEFARRQTASAPPSPLATIDWSPLETILKEYAAFCASAEYHEDNDWKSYIFENAVSCVFGEAFWVWRRKAQQLGA